MTDPSKLYESHIIKGSYFNLMLDCGHEHNQWVQNALCYLPQDILNEYKENLVFLTAADLDGCRVARHYCENREMILLSERILPKAHVNEGHSEVRYFIYVVLHEVAHAIKKHKSPKFYNLSSDEKKTQENEADELAIDWFNQHIECCNNPNLKPFNWEEIEREQKKQVVLRGQIYTDVLRDCTKCEFDYKEFEVENTEI